MSYAATVHDVLTREYGEKRNAAKKLARAIGVSPRTVENWLSGICAPRGDEMISLMANCETLKNEILNLVEQRKAG